jgi:hypothetical protein
MTGIRSNCRRPGLSEQDNFTLRAWEDARPGLVCVRHFNSVDAPLPAGFMGKSRAELGTAAHCVRKEGGQGL